MICQILNKNGINTAQYIKTLEGKNYTIFEERFCIILKYISGKVYKNNVGNNEMLKESAQYLAKIVNALKELPLMNCDDMKSYFSVECLENFIGKAKQIITDFYPKTRLDRKMLADVNDKIEIAEQLKHLDFSKFNCYTVANSHGDYNQLQFIYQKKKIKAIIDYVASKALPISWEIIRSYSSLDKKAKKGVFDIENFVDYVKYFNEIYPLCSADLTIMPYLFLLQLSTSLYGYKQFFAKTANKDLIKYAQLRTNISKYLLKNAEMLVNALQKNIVVKK